MEILQSVADSLQVLKDRKPLIHHITNYVTVNECANMTLAIGASPVMADDIGEVEEMVSFAAALVLNMGTLNCRTIESMLAAGKKAHKMGIPIIFDPVGVGATTLRTVIAQRIINEVCPSVIRGNMSEIKMIAGFKENIKGVDSVASVDDGEQVAQELSHKLACVVAITGKKDIIAQGEKVVRINNGHPMLSLVTGTGCMCTSLIGTYCGVTKDYLIAATAGIMTMGIAGEIAYKNLSKDDGSGNFRVKLMDAIYNFSSEDIDKMGKAYEK